MSKEIKFDIEAREALKNGVDIVANAVKVTLGAKGRNVAIQDKYGAPQVTKDGVTVAKSIELPDPVENMGCKLVQEVASKAVDDAGDGTTTATVLAQAILTEGLKSVTSGANPMDLKRGIDKAVETVLTYLDGLAIDIKDNPKMITQVATTSANNDSFIGKIISDAIQKVTVDGVITVEESKDNTTYVEVVEGVKFINGLLSPYFVTNPQNATAEFENPLIFFYGKKVPNTKEILPVIEMALKTSRPFLIIANDYEGEVIHTLVQNRVQKGYQIAAVKSPSFGDKRKNYLEDLALLTGGVVVTEEKGLTPTDFTMDMFGEASKVVISPEDTTLVGCQGDVDLIKERVNNLKNQIKEAKQEWDENELQDRVSKLSGGVGVLYVGANTEVEMGEKKDRIDDALAATRAAIQEGIIAGGGISLLNASVLNVETENEDQAIGANILMKAIEQPFRQIVMNAGKEAGLIMGTIMGMYPKGYDVKNDSFADMIISGIIDPKKVTRVALESAASIASLILTTQTTVSDLKE